MIKKTWTPKHQQDGAGDFCPDCEFYLDRAKCKECTFEGTVEHINFRYGEFNAGEAIQLKDCTIRQAIMGLIGAREYLNRLYRSMLAMQEMDARDLENFTDEDGEAIATAIYTFREFRVEMSKVNNLKTILYNKEIDKESDDPDQVVIASAKAGCIKVSMDFFSSQKFAQKMYSLTKRLQERYEKSDETY